MVASLATIDAFAPRHPPDPGDDAGGMHVAAIEAVGRQRRQFEKCRAGIDQQIDALARQHLAARGMPGARGLAAAAGHLIELVAQLGDQRPHGLGIAGKIGRGGIDAGMKRHGLPRFMVRRNLACGLASWCHCAAAGATATYEQPAGDLTADALAHCRLTPAERVPIRRSHHRRSGLSGSRARRAGTRNCRHRRPAGAPAPSARSPDRQCPRARNRRPRLPWCRSGCVSCCFMSPEQVQPISGSIDPRLLRLVVELPFLGLGGPRLHRVFGGLKDACGHGWSGPVRYAAWKRVVETAGIV